MQTSAFWSYIKNTPWIRYSFELLYNIVIIIFVVIILRSYIISPYHVSGQSMVPTLNNSDYILVDRLSYHLTQPKFGDIIVFTPPTPREEQANGLQCFFAHITSFDVSLNACMLPDFFIKRIIGLPGDVIEVKDGEVIRNGSQLDEPYLSPINAHHTMLTEDVQYHKYTVPAGKYFVLGDNRTGSSDSRAHAREWSDGKGHQDPFIHFETIQGRLLFILLSPAGVRGYLQNLLTFAN